MRLKLHPGIKHDDKEMATHVGMAHFAKTGPANTFCSQCDYRSHGGCAKFAQMTKGGIKVFPKETPSCRHFIPKDLQIDRVIDG